MEDVRPRHGSNLCRKVGSLWGKIVRSDVRSRYSRLKAEDRTYSHDVSTNPNVDSGGSASASSRNCFSFRMPYGHDRRRLCRHMSFTETRKERLEQVKGKIKGWVRKNRNGDNTSGKDLPKDIPKGFVAVCVGDKEEERTRFVIPVWYFNHPLFLHLLGEAEAVYGFNQTGVFTIPCQISDFEYLQWLIERGHNFKS